MIAQACTVSRRRGGPAGRLIAACVLLALSGCSYLETQLARTAPPDDRVEIGWQERRSLSAREIPRYTCPDNYFLRCERGGASTYSCTCALF